MKFWAWIRPWLNEDEEDVIEISADTQESAQAKASAHGCVMLVKQKEEEKMTLKEKVIEFMERLDGLTEEEREQEKSLLILDAVKMIMDIEAAMEILKPAI